MLDSLFYILLSVSVILWYILSIIIFIVGYIIFLPFFLTFKLYVFIKKFFYKKKVSE